MIRDEERFKKLRVTFERRIIIAADPTPRPIVNRPTVICPNENTAAWSTAPTTKRAHPRYRASFLRSGQYHVAAKG